jgi:hypothetical protein
MKTLSTSVLNLKLLDTLRLAQESRAGRDLRGNAGFGYNKQGEAISFLNSLGWNEDLQQRIWDQLTSPEGGRNVNGVWVPNTANWADQGAVRAYRAAIQHEASASIISPGVELPKMMNRTMLGRLVFNLKSFAMASTSKTLMAGLQQRDMAVLNGVWISLALGALSFYLRSVLAGGATEERMRNATPEQWVDEAFDASGILGAVSMVTQVSQDIPYLRNVSTLGNLSRTLQGKTAEQSLRSSDSGLIEDALGPAADFTFTMAQIITGTDHPTKAQIHRVRQMLPFQNLFYLRRLFDQLEEAGTRNLQ